MSTADPSLSAFLDSVTALAANTERQSPPVFLEQIAVLEQQFADLRKYRKPAILRERLSAFVLRRFGLVDEGHEYQQAGNEVLVLSMILVHHGELLAPALQTAITQLSGVLTLDGVIPVFGKLLARLRGVARTLEDEELRDWVEKWIEALP